MTEYRREKGRYESRESLTDGCGTGGVEVRWRGKFKAPPRPGLMWSEISHRWVSQKEADPTGATGYLKRLVRVTSGTTPEELKTAAESIATEFAHNDKPEYAKTFKEGTATIFQEEGKSLTQLKDGLKRLMEKHKHQIEDSLGTGKDKEAREDEGSAETHETKLQAEAAEAEKK